MQFYELRCNPCISNICVIIVAIPVKVMDTGCTKYYLWVISHQQFSPPLFFFAILYSPLFYSIILLSSLTSPLYFALLYSTFNFFTLFYSPLLCFICAQFYSTLLYFPLLSSTSVPPFCYTSLLSILLCLLCCIILDSHRLSFTLRCSLNCFFTLSHFTSCCTLLSPPPPSFICLFVPLISSSLNSSSLNHSTLFYSTFLYSILMHFIIIILLQFFLSHLFSPLILCHMSSLFYSSFIFCHALFSALIRLALISSTHLSPRSTLYLALFSHPLPSLFYYSTLLFSHTPFISSILLSSAPLYSTLLPLIVSHLTCCVRL